VARWNGSIVVRAAISLNKKGKKAGVTRIRAASVSIEAGNRGRDEYMRRKTQRCVAPRGPDLRLPHLRSDAARRGACVHARRGYRRQARHAHTRTSGGEKINSVIRARVRRAACDTSHTLKRRRSMEWSGGGEERKSQALQAGTSLTPLSPCPMSYKRICPFNRALS